MILNRRRRGPLLVGIWIAWLIFAVPLFLLLEPLVRGSDLQFGVACLLGLAYLFLPQVLTTFIDD